MASATASFAQPGHNPTTVVQAFAAAWGRLDFSGIEALLGPEIRFANGPLPVLQGLSQVMTYLRGAGPFEACRWDMLLTAADGTRVLTERVDHLVVRGTAIALPVMGVFDVREGLIHAWRDYFDLAAYRAQWPA